MYQSGANDIPAKIARLLLKRSSNGCVIERLHIRERDRVHRQQHRVQIETRAHDQRADDDVRYRQQSHQRFEIVGQGQHHEQVEPDHQKADGTPGHEAPCHLARLVDTGQQADRRRR